MSEMAPEGVDSIGRTASHLRAILGLADDLMEQAINDANSRLLPGGYAMVELGPVANIEAWENQCGTDERAGTHYTQPDLEDPETGWPTVQRIRWWANEWRRELGAEYDQRDSLASDVNFLRFHLEWGYSQSAWGPFANDVYLARRRMEDLLDAGTRDIISDDVTCLICDTQLRRRMTRETGYEDEWWCVDCHHHLTPAQFNLAASEAARKAFGLDRV